jgi:solute carrier family 25 protein 39/40
MRDAILMVKKDGALSLWRGIGVTLWRDVPFSAIYWYGYETGKLQLTKDHPDWNRYAVSFICGASSGVVAATITTPFDVAKTRRQMELSQVSDKSLLESANESGTLHILQRIRLHEGYGGLFKGLSARIAKVAPSCAVMIATYEFGKNYFGVS